MNEWLPFRIAIPLLMAGIAFAVASIARVVGRIRRGASARPGPGSPARLGAIASSLDARQAVPIEEAYRASAIGIR